MSSVVPFLLVGVGGFVGANARLIVAQLVTRLVGTQFPLGTFLINVSGSFLLGVLWPVVTQRLGPTSDALRLSLGVGFLGAFTTFSTFELETHALLENGSWSFAAANVVGSVAAGLLAMRAGVVLAKMWL